MVYIETELPGAFLIDLEPRADTRGFFARTFCAREFDAHGLRPAVAQCSVAFSYRKGCIRGLHYQRAPATEVKLIRCTRGAIYDVIVDLRSESPSYLRHIAVQLSADNRRGLYVPEQFAHGYQVLEDETEVCYQMSAEYAPQYEGGIRYDDPALGISWPLPVTDISAKDASWPPYTSGA